MTHAAATAVPSTRGGFLQNVIWGWAAVVVNLLIGLILSPIIIRRLGIEQYGVWVLLFSLIDYMRVLDFGVRAAVVNACARARAREDWQGVNRAVVTALAYFAGIGVVSMLLLFALRDPLIGAVDGIPPSLAADARTLIVLIAVTIVTRLVLSPLTGALEGFQRFDVVNRAYIGALLFRSTLSLTVLLMGYGLIEMAYVVLTAQLGESAYTWLQARRIVRGLRFTTSAIARDSLTGLFQYGKFSAMISASNLVAINAPATVLAYVRGTTEVGFFALPFRLLMYAAEGLAKVSDVTSSVTAALDETGDRQKLWRLAVVTNRNCFALFVPLALYLLVYGVPLLARWVNPEIAAHSSPLMYVMLLNFSLAVAGQHNAGAVLIGQGRHAKFAYGTLIEAIAAIVLLLIVVPVHGAIGAAWVVAVTVVASRCLYVAYLVCQINGFSLGRYLAAIYVPGLLTGVPVLALAVALHAYLWPGESWIQLIAAGTVIAASYFALAWLLVLDREDRAHVLRFARR